MTKDKTEKNPKKELKSHLIELKRGGNIYIENTEHPKYFNNRDITNKGKYTKAKATDLESYYKWIELEQQEILNKNRVIEVDGYTVNIGMPLHNFRRAIEHFPDEIQEDLLDQKEEFNKALSHCGGIKSLAFAVPKSEMIQHKRIERLEEKKTEILELFGRMFSPEEVHRIAVQQLGLRVGLKEIVDFRRKYLIEITSKIEEFKRDFKDIRLAIKKGRIEELVFLYERVKDRWLATHMKSDQEFLLKLIEALRKETDGDLIKVEGDMTLKVEHNITVHLQKEITAKMNLTQIVLGRVASRLDINPVHMISQMTDSIYARFNSMVTSQDDVEDAEYVELEYPSNKPYDFSQIEEKQKEHLKEKEKKDKELTLEHSQKNKEGEKLGIKEKMLKKLESYVTDNREGKNDMAQSALDLKVMEAEEKIDPNYNQNKVKEDSRSIIDVEKDVIDMRSFKKQKKEKKKKKGKKKNKD